MGTLDLINTCMQDYCRAPISTLGGCPFHDLTFTNPNDMILPFWFDEGPGSGSGFQNQFHRVVSVTLAYG